MASTARAWLMDVGGGFRVAAGGHQVVEYLLSPETVRLPLTPAHCRGVMIWREQMIPVVDLTPLLPGGLPAVTLAAQAGETANAPSLARGPRLDPIGETANGPSLARGPRLDPIGETANAPSLARGPRLDPIGETANGPSLARGPCLDPIGETEARGWRRAVVLAYQEAPGESLRYGALMVRAAPLEVFAADDMACPLPDDAEVFRYFACACFAHDDKAVPVLDTARLFARPLPTMQAA